MYGQSYSSCILVHLSDVVISYVYYFMDAKFTHRHVIGDGRKYALILPVYDISSLYSYTVQMTRWPKNSLCSSVKQLDNKLTFNSKLSNPKFFQIHTS